MEYDYSKINDKEFEVLTCDVLSAHFGKRVERFKKGKDGGVDGRFFSIGRKEVVVQCKHYLGSGYKSLISILKRKELEKVKKLSPSNYFLATTLPLSRANKEEIFSLFHEFMSSESDIFGKEDFDDLLEQNPKIVEKHFKLWFCSTAVFKTLLNAAIKGRSGYELERMAENVPRYIETEYHSLALEHLKKRHVLIVTGEPGIGKTTLAENICLFYVSKGFEFLDIEDSISEAEAVYIRGTKQIFLFDDFLGSNYLEAIENKRDSHVVKFINRILKDEDKRFILTSRTNILNSGYLHSPYFQNSNLRKSEFQLLVSGLTPIDKAQILYNHMWFSKLGPDFMEEIYDQKNYLKIIEHANYNPRLISFITDSNRVPVDSSGLYWHYIEESLRNPKDVWGDCFKRQSNAFVRNLVCLCVFNGGTIEEIDLKASFQNLNELEGIQNPTNTMKDFDSMVRLCTKAFLNRNMQGKRKFFTLFNPSLADYIINEFCFETQTIANVFHALRTMSAIKNLDLLVRESSVDIGLATFIKQKWFDLAIASENSTAWGREIVESHLSDLAKRTQIVDFAREELRRVNVDEDMSSFLKVLWVCRNGLHDCLSDFLNGLLERGSLEREELSALAPFVETMYTTDSKEFLQFCEEVTSQIEADVENEVESMDLSECIDHVWGYKGDEDIQPNTDKFYGNLLTAAEETLLELNCSFLESDINYSDFCYNFDADEYIRDYFKSLCESNYESKRKKHADEELMSKEIEDLFERQ